MQQMQEMWVWSLGWEVPLEEEMTTHSSILTWKILWTEETGRLSQESHKESVIIKHSRNNQNNPSFSYYVLNVWDMSCFLVKRSFQRADNSIFISFTKYRIQHATIYLFNNFYLVSALYKLLFQILEVK